MGIFVGQHFKRLGQQRITGQNRCRLVKLLVAAGLAATQIVVIHRRQIIMDQRIAVHHLDRGRHTKGGSARYLEQASRAQHQKRAQPFAIAQRRITHRLIQALLDLAIGAGQDPVKRLAQISRRRTQFGNHVVTHDGLRLFNFGRCCRRAAIRIQGDFFDALFSRAQFVRAMAFQRRTAFIGRNGVIKPDLPLFKLTHKGFKLPKRLFETQFRDIFRNCGRCSSLGHVSSIS